MFDTGQTVLYGSNGVCTIDGVTVRSVGGTDVEYYVLKPICSRESTLYVPVGNERLVGKIRRVLSADEINSILSHMPECDEWIDSKIERSERFKEIISQGECEELIKLIRLIHRHGEQQIANGKRLHISDERFLKEAEKMICEEFSLVLNIDRDEVIGRILKQSA